MSLAFGRDLIAIPGPSITPDRVLQAMMRPAPDIYGDEIIETTLGVLADLKRVARTSGEAVIYIGNGHGVWEASVANVLAPGDKALAILTGRFGAGWAATARRMGVDVSDLDFGGASALDPDRVEAALRADTNREIRAVMSVQTDTATSAHNDIRALRAAIDAAGHPALLMVDCIACMGCAPFEMDDWGVDVALAAGQKGLMTPPGLAFTFHNEKAWAARADCPSPYWDWATRVNPEVFYQRFAGTPPTHHIFALRAALDILLKDEGLEAAWERHGVLASAVWAAVECWSVDSAIRLNIANPKDRSVSVTTIHTGLGDADRLRRWCRDKAGLTLGVAIPEPGAAASDQFRIGHMGHLNAPMLLGAITTIDAGFKALDIAHGGGASEAAAQAVADAG